MCCFVVHVDVVVACAWLACVCCCHCSVVGVCCSDVVGVVMSLSCCVGVFLCCLGRL